MSDMDAGHRTWSAILDIEHMPCDIAAGHCFLAPRQQVLMMIQTYAAAQSDASCCVETEDRGDRR